MNLPISLCNFRGLNQIVFLLINILPPTKNFLAVEHIIVTFYAFGHLEGWELALIKVTMNEIENDVVNLSFSDPVHHRLYYYSKSLALLKIVMSERTLNEWLVTLCSLWTFYKIYHVLFAIFCKNISCLFSGRWGTDSCIWSHLPTIVQFISLVISFCNMIFPLFIVWL